MDKYKLLFLHIFIFIRYYVLESLDKLSAKTYNAYPYHIAFYISTIILGILFNYCIFDTRLRKSCLFGIAIFDLILYFMLIFKYLIFIHELLILVGILLFECLRRGVLKTGNK